MKTPVQESSNLSFLGLVPVFLWIILNNVPSLFGPQKDIPFISIRMVSPWIILEKDSWTSKLPVVFFNIRRSAVWMIKSTLVKTNISYSYIPCKLMVRRWFLSFLNWSLFLGYLNFWGWGFSVILLWCILQQLFVPEVDPLQLPNFQGIDVQKRAELRK